MATRPMALIGREERWGEVADGFMWVLGGDAERVERHLAGGLLSLTVRFEICCCACCFVISRTLLLELPELS